MRGTTSVNARRWTVGVAILTSLVVVSVAFAAPWATESNGKAGAKAGHIDPIVATAATPASELLPGESADAALSLTNPNRIAMVVTSIVGNGTITSSSAACDAAGHGVTFVDQTGEWPIAKGAALAVSLPNAVRMAITSAAECQDATFSIPVKVSAVATNNGGGAPTTTAAPTTSTSAASPARLHMPSPHVFPSTMVGQSSPAWTFTLHNVGGSPGQVQLGIVGGPDFPFVSTTCSGVTLAPGQNCNVVVRFAPTSAGTKSGRLEAKMSHEATFGVTSLTGFGETPPQLSITPSSFAFGNVAVGQQATASFMVRNTGTQPTGTVVFSVGGTNAGDFDVTPTCANTIAGGESCQILVHFHPSSGGAKTAFAVASASPGGSATTDLSGAGV